MSSDSVHLSEEVQRLQKELQAAQSRLQSVADASGSLMGKLELALDANGCLLLVGADAMADQLLGKACAPFLEAPFFSLFPGLKVTDFLSELMQVAQHGGVFGPDSLLGEDLLSGKSYHFFAFQLAPGRVVVKFWDASDAADSMEMRMRGQQQLAAMFSDSPAAISLSRESDGAYVDVNAEWSRLTGLALQDVLGKTTIEVGFWADTRQREAVLGTMGAQGRLRNLDLPFVRPDGEKRNFQLNLSRIEIGGSVYLLSYLRDVSTERLAQAELLATDRHFNHMSPSIAPWKSPQPT